MFVVRQKLEGKQISTRAISLIMKSWRPATQKQYNVYIKKWRRYCFTRKVNFRSASIEVVLDFLAELDQQGFSYSAINTARGALSAIMTPHKEQTVGNHPLVKRLLKGVFEARPSKPRYTTTWSVGKVLVYLKRLSPVHGLSLKQLTLKLTMLLALTTAQRVQTLKALDLKHFTKGANYTFSIVEKIKQSRPGTKTPIVTLEPFPPDRRLCIITVIKEYIKRTADLRLGETKLLISYVKPHKVVTRDTIARWICMSLKNSGIDTNTYKAHSTRAAATSMAADRLVPIEDILAVAGWANTGTFQKFYHKPVTPRFQHKVLNGK